MEPVVYSIITKEFEKNVGRNTDKAMLISFKLSNYDEVAIQRNRNKEEFRNRYPSRQILIWGRDNYVAVFVQDSLMHPEEHSQWYLQGCHDSCWRDTLWDILWKMRDCRQVLLDDLFMTGWYKIIDVSEEIKEILKNNRSWQQPRHPLLSKRSN